MALRHLCLLALALVCSVAGHATVSWPAMRFNPSAPKYCPWCQGSATKCDPKFSHAQCLPPSPCWGDKPGTMIPQQYFGKWKAHVMPDRKPWVATGVGGIPTWCPGDVVPIRTFLNADHNGAYRWESQLAAPGRETEKAFANITSWKSINMDPDTDYYASNGVTKLTPGKCYPPGKCAAWGASCSHCRNNVFSSTSLKLPSSMPAGQTVLRWFWYGAMTTAGVHVHGPEHSLFVNCKDIVVGTAEQCQARKAHNDTLV